MPFTTWHRILLTTFSHPLSVTRCSTFYDTAWWFMTHADKSFAPLNSVIWCNYSSLWRFGSSTCPGTRKKNFGILPYSPLHLIAEDEPSIERRYTLVILPPRTRRRKISNSTDALSPSQAPIFFFFTSEQRSTSPPASFSNPVRRVAPAHRQCSSERGREFVASLHDVDSAQGSGGYFDF